MMKAAPTHSEYTLFGYTLSVYRCNNCGGWHVGNRYDDESLEEAVSRYIVKRRRIKQQRRERFEAYLMEKGDHHDYPEHPDRDDHPGAGGGDAGRSAPQP